MRKKSIPLTNEKWVAVPDGLVGIQLGNVGRNCQEMTVSGFDLRNVVVAAVASILVVTACLAPGAVVSAGELDLRPIETTPEPLSRLDPKLSWMTKEKVRVIWIGGDLFEKYDGGEKTKARVILDAGFNLVRVSMGVNSDNTRSGAVDTTGPLELKRDRSKSTDLETRLGPNVEEARRVGLAFMVGWQYGSQHLEPYRKYRSPKGQPAKITCCPIEETYITGQHVGKWAVKIAEGGADGMVIDMEMYHSDTAWPQGPCTCDDCFAAYLKSYARSWRTTYDRVAAETRGSWLADQKADEHYAAYAAKRIEALYNCIRRRCQEINPAFFFGMAPQLHHLPGVVRGLGTASAPCLVLSEHEYNHGPYRGSFIGVRDVRRQLPALFLCGAYVAVQPPQMLAESALQSSLYCDGWWAYYGTALLSDVGVSKAPWTGYGRVPGTSARDYLDRIAATHAKLDTLLQTPNSQWPERRDGKLAWLKARVAEAKDAKALAEAKADLERYMVLVRMGGY